MSIDNNWHGTVTHVFFGRVVRIKKNYSGGVVIVSSLMECNRALGILTKVEIGGIGSNPNGFKLFYTVFFLSEITEVNSWVSWIILFIVVCGFPTSCWNMYYVFNAWVGGCLYNGMRKSFSGEEQRE